MSEKDGHQHSDHDQNAARTDAEAAFGPPNDGGSEDAEKKSEPPSWVEKWTFYVLVATFAAALIGAIEADRLARDTEQALGDAREVAHTTHLDAINTENLTADAIGQSQANSNGTHDDTMAAIRRSDIGNTISRESAISGERAWVYPSATNIDGEVTVGQPLKAIITYLNSGREPATAFIPIIRFASFKKEDWLNGNSAKVLERWKDGCFKTTLNPKAPKNATTRAVYPIAGVTNYNMEPTSADEGQSPPIKVTDALTKGDEIVALQGCFIYRSVGILRHTAFCSFYQSPITKPPNMNICSVANNAD